MWEDKVNGKVVLALENFRRNVGECVARSESPECI